MGRKLRLDRETMTQVCLYSKEHGAKLTCEKYGISGATLSRWLNALDMKKRDNVASKPGVKEQVLAYCRDNPHASQSDVARIHKIARSTLCTWLKEAKGEGASTVADKSGVKEQALAYCRDNPTVFIVDVALMHNIPRSTLWTWLKKAKDEGTSTEG